MSEQKYIRVEDAAKMIRDNGVYGAGYSDKEREEDVIDMIESVRGYTPAEILAGMWVPVTERLPDADVLVMVYVPKRDGCNQHGMFKGMLHTVKADTTGKDNFWGLPTPGCDWTLYGWGYFDEPIVTHWMPLPQPPKEATP